MRGDKFLGQQLCRKESHPFLQKAVLPIKKQVGQESAIEKDKKETGNRNKLHPPTTPFPANTRPSSRTAWPLDMRGRGPHTNGRYSVQKAHLTHLGQREKQWKEEAVSQAAWVCVPALPLTVLPLGKLHNLFPSVCLSFYFIRLL